MASSTQVDPFPLSQLPKELRDIVYSYVERNDTKSLRVTCSAMAKDVPLRFDRVFLSANSLNIQVFRAIADHESFRHQVSEIIWDDARLSTGPELEEERLDYFDDNPDRAVTANGCPLWFKSGRLDTRCHFNNCRMPGESLGLWESWAYYKSLLQDQCQILVSNADIEAFKYGLRRFPSLKRVTITPATHGRLWQPLYRTPMIRAFPRGFDYPIPKAWPCSSPMPIDALPWESQEGDRPYQAMYGVGCDAEAYRAKWRGYRAVTRVLVECGQDHHVTELIICGNEIGSGINCHIFDQPCVEYDDLVTLLKRPGFRRLDLDLFTGLLEHEDWVSYKSGLLYNALSQAKSLQHLCLRSTTGIADGWPQQLDPEEVEEFVFPLRTIFPIDHWPQLQHFGLSNFLVPLNDLISLLAALPKSLRSVELSHLGWGSLDANESYHDLLRKIRDTLDWRSRPMEERPKVHMVASAAAYSNEEGYVQVDEAVYSFLYGDGKSPFDHHPNIIYPGEGGVERDIFDPGVAVPF
ncbi:hypothetical protein FSARC_3241 [Fusarium sarcochroum]|uniref:F-box domain-containing protein n=1 Tax=Fusarium sarcochroum TaxID=1208366 RepID=A0A8H4XC03_9HYPO|nr:hypothetical protein FSARC_3241 [Fusarium sarcochroum]